MHTGASLDRDNAPPEKYEISGRPRTRTRTTACGPISTTTRASGGADAGAAAADAPADVADAADAADADDAAGAADVADAASTPIFILRTAAGTLWEGPGDLSHCLPVISAPGARKTHLG